MTPDRPGVPRLQRPHHGRAKTAPLFAVLVALSSLPAVAALPGPESVAFAKGAKFAVAGYTGGETLTNFPVLVRISDNAPAGFTYADVRSASAAASAQSPCSILKNNDRSGFPVLIAPIKTATSITTPTIHNTCF